EFNNIFYLDDYNKNSFIKTIEDNNILFIMKPHPRDEFFYKKNPDVLPDTANFKIVYNEDFYNNGIENYELFKFVDVMVSDYSSAPIDYLILNRPVIYLNSLAEGYSAKRGMILEENYEILMPGVKVVTYKDFEQQLLDNLYKDSYKQERERLLPLIHKYMDFNSCKRIYKVIESLKK
ncbi:CDP-glycerol glycerophosphotransferase family protein, partial [bacterium]|nr:CDP-glycerol glycerophosphotransferase family protein [bacterium]